MNANNDQDVSTSDDSASLKKGRNKILLIGPAILAVLLFCTCIQLVLNGIIAEPETLINQIGEFLFGRR
jgi:hypothetical protein